MEWLASPIDAWYERSYLASNGAAWQDACAALELTLGTIRERVYELLADGTVPHGGTDAVVDRKDMTGDRSSQAH